MANIKMSQYIRPAILIGNLTLDSCVERKAPPPAPGAVVSRQGSNSRMIQANELVIGPVCVDEQDITV